ncbi:cation:proton antiporter [Nonomuraea fuscirosea]|uniref:cation:proton antiporter n=1 Tax=Nonomuraea fuscirosea TaxID=1291556 RepID=UPI002DDBB7CA|nr:cation:proton antiporter [Nonomuraea fuscirosea]WSA50976.1 cation:proton antiporter [Nonomuraea fuscirosea]
MGSSLLVAAVLAVTILIGSMISVEVGLSVSIIEIVAGVALGNTLHLATPDWLVFLASFGSVVLTFLAGAEVDPADFRATWRASILIGFLSFLAPFAGALLLLRYGFAWEPKAAQIGGIALSTTSLAVVYAVLVETGLNATRIGKLIMSATFVTDLGTVAALSVLFIQPSWWLIPFAAVSVALIAVMPRLDRWFFARYGNRVIEPEIKGAFAALLVLMWLGDQARSHAVLPAFLLGLAVARTFQRHPATQRRFRVVAFALLTPFFFLRSGMNVSLPLVWANLGLLGVLLAAKLAAKSVAVYPLARHYAPRHAPFVTLLMSTGLTFGTISATYGLTAGYIDKAQFSVLVTVVVLTAVIPTAIAQRFFSPQPATEAAVGPAAEPAPGPAAEPAGGHAPGHGAAAGPAAPPEGRGHQGAAAADGRDDRPYLGKEGP